jgi:hypothetical protein
MTPRTDANASVNGSKGGGKGGSFVPDPEFFGKEGICGLDATKVAGIHFVTTDNGEDTELIPLVVSGNPPATSKVKLQYGHHVTKAIAKYHDPATSFYMPPS